MGWRSRSLLGSVSLVVASLAGMASTPAGALGAERAPAATAVGSSLTTEMYSTSLERDVQVEVYLPPRYSRAGGPYPVLYLLHGFPGSGPQMVAELNLPTQMDRLIDAGTIPPTVVIAPSDGPTPATDTEWVDSSVHPSWKWGSFVREDLVAWTDASYSVCETRAGRFVGGISMGGYGAADAMTIDPELYEGALLLSPYFVSNTPKVSGAPGSRSWRLASPLYTVAARVKAHVRGPSMRVLLLTSRDDGQAYLESRQFAEYLHTAGDPTRYIVAGDPAHNYSFWAPLFASEASWLLAGASC